MKFRFSLCPLINVVLGDIQVSTIAPYGSSSTDVPEQFDRAQSLNYTYYQNIPISYYEYGDAAPDKPTVIGTGGWPPGAESYNDMAGALSERGIHVVLYDMRGAGKSGHPWGPEGYSITNLANEMGAVIDAVAPNRNISLYGGTWGPFIASEYAAMYPDSHRISTIFSIGCPSFDLAAQTLIDQTRALANDTQNQSEILGQWLALFYEAQISVPVIPEILALTGAPQFFTETIPDALRALNNKDADELANILGSQLAKDLLYNFGDYWDSSDEAHGEQKYQWYIFNRMLPGIISGKMYRQYLPVDRVKVWQKTNDSIQTSLLLENLGKHTPHLDLSYMIGGHNQELSGNNFIIARDTILDYLLGS